MTNSSTLTSPQKSSKKTPAKRRVSVTAVGAVLAASVALTACTALPAGSESAAVVDGAPTGSAAKAPAAKAPATKAPATKAPAAEAPEAEAAATEAPATEAPEAEAAATEAPATEAPEAEAAATEAPATEAPATETTEGSADGGVALAEPVVEASDPESAPAEESAVLASTATPTAGTSTERAALTPGSYKPTETNTGVIPGTTLTKHNTGGADLVITQDGTVLENMEIYGDIKIRAKNVVIRNSLLHGGKGAPAHESGIVDVNSAAAVNFLIEDSTIRPDRPHYFRDGIVGHDYTAKRNHISHTNDGLGIFNKPGGSVNANVAAEGNYIHTLTYFDWDPNHSDGTHNDGIQVQGGENIRIAGNNIVADAVAGEGSTDGPRTPHAGIAIMLQQNVAKLANTVVEDNWVDDGQTSINVDNGKYSNITVTVRDNKLGRNQLQYPNGTYPIRIIKRSASTVTGLSTNTWADTGAALTEGKTTGISYNS